MLKFFHVSYVFVGIIIGLGFLFTQIPLSLAQSACSSGSWTQPTCNPVINDPSSCSIDPPLFANASCLQSTGYLRIEDPSDTFNKEKWINMEPGFIEIGDVDLLQGWLHTPAGEIEMAGPLLVGNFAGRPTDGWRPGQLAVLGKIYSKDQLRVDGNTYLNNKTTISASISGATDAPLYVTNNSDGSLLYLNGRNNDVYFDTDGYLTAPNDYYINSQDDLGLRFDSDNNSVNEFKINDGRNISLLRIKESSLFVSDPEDPYVRVKGLGSQTDVTTNVFDGVIRGDFVQQDGSRCSTFSGDQLLYFDNNLDQWFCRDADAAGIGGGDTLLEVLEAGSDASSYTGGDISVGVSGGNEFIITSQTNGDAPLTIRADTNNSNDQNNPYIQFEQDGGSLEAVLGLVGNIVSREPDDTGYVGTLTNSLLLGHRDAEALQLGTDNKVRLTIESGGYTGIGTNDPRELLEIENPNFGGISRLRITDTGQNPEIQLQYGSVSASDHWSMYASQSDDSFRIWGNAADRVTILQSGNVGIGTSNPQQKLDVSGTVRGNFTDGDGNICANNEILVYNSATSKWNCSASVPGGSQGLLSVLGIDPDASPFAGETTIGGMVGIGNSVWIDSNNLWRTLHVENTVAGGDIVTRFANHGANVDAFTGIDIVQTAADNSVAMLRFDARIEAGPVPPAVPARFAIGVDGGSNGDFIISESGGADLRSNQRLVVQRLTGNVGIGIANPSVALDVNGRINTNSQGFYSMRSPTRYIRFNTSGTYNDFLSEGAKLVFNFSWSTPAENVTFFEGATNNATVSVFGYNGASREYGRFSVNNSGDFLIEAENDMLLQAGGGDVIVDKITVNTIDPVYTIKGQRYATYMAGMIGVKEETVGLINLELNKQTGFVSAQIDFNNLDKGSDLWLFAQTIDYQDNFDKIVLLLTPAFDGRVWYAKDDSNKILTIIAKPINKYSQEYEVSYRLTGPRFDYEKWSNTTDSEFEGLNLDKFYAQ